MPFRLLRLLVSVLQSVERVWPAPSLCPLRSTRCCYPALCSVTCCQSVDVHHGTMASAEPEPEPEPPTQLEPEPEPSTQQLQATDEVAAFEATHVATPGPSLYTPTVTKTGGGLLGDSPQYTFRGDSQPRSFIETAFLQSSSPGPAYHPANQTVAKSQAPRFTFGTEPRLPSPYGKDGPGPNSYRVKGNQHGGGEIGDAPKFGFGTREQNVRPESELDRVAYISSDHERENFGTLLSWSILCVHGINALNFTPHYRRVFPRSGRVLSSRVPPPESPPANGAVLHHEAAPEEQSPIGWSDTIVGKRCAGSLSDDDVVSVSHLLTSGRRILGCFLSVWWAWSGSI